MSCPLFSTRLSASFPPVCPGPPFVLDRNLRTGGRGRAVIIVERIRSTVVVSGILACKGLKRVSRVLLPSERVVSGETARDRRDGLDRWKELLPS